VESATESLDLVHRQRGKRSRTAAECPQHLKQLVAAGVVGCGLITDWRSYIIGGSEIELRAARGKESNIVKPGEYPRRHREEYGWWCDARGILAVFRLMGGSSCGRSIAPSGADPACWPGNPAGGCRSRFDLHAEAHQCSALMEAYLDGRVSAVLGTPPRVTTRRMRRSYQAGTPSMRRRHDRPPCRSWARRIGPACFKNHITSSNPQFDVATAIVRLAAPQRIVDIDEADGRPGDAAARRHGKRLQV